MKKDRSQGVLTPESGGGSNRPSGGQGEQSEPRACRKQKVKLDGVEEKLDTVYWVCRISRVGGEILPGGKKSQNSPPSKTAVE